MSAEHVVNSELLCGKRAGVFQIIIPVYNEGKNVISLYKQIKKDVGEFGVLSFIYDFDADTTLPYIREIQKSDSFVFAKKNTLGGGVINALKWSFSQVGPGPVVVVMGDNSDKLSIIPDMVSLWEQGAVIVSPSRYMRGGKQYGGGLIKSSMSRAACMSLKLLGFPTADATNNFKLYDGEWLSKQRIDSVGGFEVAIELCYKAYRDGELIIELPTVWTDRTYGESNFKIVAWLPHYLKWYFKIIWCLFRKRVL
jgi:dolichol-phosphate mannosyltransferase